MNITGINNIMAKKLANFKIKPVRLMAPLIFINDIFYRSKIKLCWRFKVRMYQEDFIT
jgi:hypothetical protein